MRLVALTDLYFLTVVALMKIGSWFLSDRLKELLVNGIAFSAYSLARTKRQRSEKNLSKAFQGRLDRGEMRAVVRGACAAFWQDTFLLLPSTAEKAALEKVDFRGLEHLRGALEKGKGVILWESRFFGRRVLAKQILHENGFAVYQVSGENHLGGFVNDGSATYVRRRLIHPFFDKCQRRWVSGIIYLPRSVSVALTRRLLEHLRQNAILCLAADGSVGQKFIPLRLLHSTELFPTGAVSMARISGASILPMFCVHGRDGEKRLAIEGPIPIEPSVDQDRTLENSLRQYVSLLESYIRRYPEQYRNWHDLGRSAQ